MPRYGSILTLVVLGLLTSSCVTPEPEPTTAPPTQTSTPSASSTPTAGPADELSEDDAAAITTALSSGDIAALQPYFAESVAYGSYGTDGREPLTAAGAVEQLTTQHEQFGPFACPADPAILDPVRPLLVESNLDWLPADAITCTSAEYIFTFVPDGATISGYFTIPVGIAG